MWGNQGGYDQGTGGYGNDQGGGYMNQQPGFGSPQMSQEKKRTRAQNILPCTVAQIISSEQQDDKFMIDGIEINQVTIVGLVRAVKENATRLDYEVDDMTGPPLEVKQFVDNDENSPDEDRTIPMRENTYVRVYGHVRAFNGKRSITAFKLKPLLDMNELTTHLLEVIHSHLSLTKAAAGGSTTSYGNSNAMDTTNTTAPGEYAGAQGDGMNGLSPVQQQVSLVIKSCNDDTGVNINFITQKLRGIPRPQIMDAIDFLSSEGHIYSTIDDEHFKSTDSM